MKKIALVSLAALMLSGCLTTQHRMDLWDLKYMKPDCNNKAAQIHFLETQLSTPWERALAANNTHSMFGAIRGMMNGSYDHDKAIESRQYDAVAKRLIWEIRTTCP